MELGETIRPGEIKTTLPDQSDAGIYFIGRIELDRRWQAALEGIADHPRLQVLYWMHQARRDLLVQMPRRAGKRSGTFALRSPVRPNPIASSVVALVSVTDNVVIVRGLDCLDGTPLIDLKPARD
jgi:tRNA (adenine37-N6)-methyltransferase